MQTRQSLPQNLLTYNANFHHESVVERPCSFKSVICVSFNYRNYGKGEGSIESLIKIVQIFFQAETVQTLKRRSSEILS